MISFKKFDNQEEMYSCNSCHNFKDHKLFELIIGFSINGKMVNGGQLVYLCPKCAKELKETIKLRSR